LLPGGALARKGRKGPGEPTTGNVKGQEQKHYITEKRDRGREIVNTFVISG